MNHNTSAVVDLRKVIRAIHRDTGYIFFGMTVIYAVSGILLNHIRDWNSNYDISLERVSLKWSGASEVSDEDARKLLEQIGEAHGFKKYHFPSPNQLKVFFENGSMEMNTINGEATVERFKKRPILFELNFLHYNPGVLWKYFSDAFCVSLLVIAVTGLFVLKGKKGIKGRGAWLCGLGILVPIIFLLFYL